MLRLFIALPVPDPVAHALAALQRGVPGARWSPRSNLHVTLRFVGDLDEARAGELDEALGQITVPGFDMSVGRGGFFGGAQPHALHVHASGGEGLAALRRRCERACRDTGLAPNTRAYTPHVTLAYLSRAADPALAVQFEQVNALFSAGPWRADRFYLYSSRLTPRGSAYRIEAEYPLDG